MQQDINLTLLTATRMQKEIEMLLSRLHYDSFSREIIETQIRMKNGTTRLLYV